MTQKAGTYADGQLWLRCPFCGDSTRSPWKAHFNINSQGLYYCYRCKASGRLPTKERIRLLTKYGMDHGVIRDNKSSNWRETWSETIPGPGSSRFSVIPRPHLLTNKGFFDVFPIKDIQGLQLGIQLVNVGTGKKKIKGNVKKGFGYAADSLEDMNLEDPIILVEGPYDVVDTNYVCTFGIPSYSQLRELRGFWVVLYPDGDVWKDRSTLFNLKRNLKRAMTQGLILEGVLHIPDATKDPADIWKENGEVELLTAQEFMRWT